MCERGQISGAAVALNAQREHRGLRDVHAFSSESIPPRGLSLTHLAGKGLLVACHGHEAEKLAGMARIYIYPEPDLRPAYGKLAYYRKTESVDWHKCRNSARFVARTTFEDQTARKAP